MNKLYGIGVGPGDKEYLTLKGHHVLQNAKTIFTPMGKDKQPGIAYRIVKDFIPVNTPVVTLDFPMIELEKNHRSLETVWKENAWIIAETLKEGDCVFLTLGDPFIFSTYSYILDYLESKQVEVETVPGISSFSGLAARLNIPLTQGDESLAIAAMTRKNEDIRDIVKMHTTVIIMKVSADPLYLKQILIEEELEDHFVLVSNVSTPGEKITTDLNDINETVPYMSTMIIHKARQFNER